MLLFVWNFNFHSREFFSTFFVFPESPMTMADNVSYMDDGGWTILRRLAAM